MNNESTWIFIVDTQQYAGEFADRLCAFCTGHTSSGLPQKEKEMFQQEFLTFSEMILEYQENEFGELNPWTLWPTPGWHSDGLGFHYRIGTLSEENIRSEKVDRFKKWKEDHHDPVTNRELKRIQESPIDFPAMLSVAFFFKERPSTEIIQQIMERSKLFAQKENITLQSFRLLEKKVTFNLEFFTVSDEIV